MNSILRLPVVAVPGLAVALSTFGASDLRAQDVQMPVAQFLELQPSDQYAIAGVVLGSAIAMGELLALQDPPEHIPLTDCVREWEDKQPDTFITTLTTSWVQMAEIEIGAASLGGTPPCSRGRRLDAHS